MKQLLEESKEEYSQSKLRFDIARTSGKSTSKLQKVNFNQQSNSNNMRRKR